MSEQERRRERNEVAQPKTPATNDKDKPSDAPPEAGAAQPKYVFKIAPADPKNAFDFEDVADK